MNIVELQKQRMLLRKTDPVRAVVYSALVDAAKKEAKKESRDVTDADILLMAKRGLKSSDKCVKEVRESETYKVALRNVIAETNKVIQEIGDRKHTADEAYTIGQLENVLYPMDAYIRNAQDEYDIYEEFLPTMVSEGIIVGFITVAIDGMDESQRNMKAMGRLIGEIKKTYGDTVDMGMASKLVKKALS